MNTHVCPNCNHHIPLNTVEERFWAKVDKLGPIPINKPCEGSCWLWCGYISPHGYGIIGAGSVETNGYRAHRMSWEIHNQQDAPEGLVIRHQCDNKRCVNPDHLILGTRGENNKDWVERGKAVNEKVDGTYHVCPNCNYRIQLNTTEEKFWAKVDKHGPEVTNSECVGNCWLWCGGVDNKGYGKFGSGNRKTHREAWKYWNKQEIPEGIVVRHMCDNPLCVNPAHLVLGTHKDNVHDRERRGRSNHRSGEDSSQSKLTEEQVIAMRKDYATGNYFLHELDEKYGTKKGNARYVCKRLTWKHVA